MMAKAGVTPERIAGLHGLPVRKVRDYVGRVRREHPQLFVGAVLVHDRPRPRPATWPDRDRRFKDRLAEYVAFVDEHGRRPSASHQEEFSLAHWLITQRSKERHGRLLGHRRRWLDDALPSWRVDDRQIEYDARWTSCLAEVITFHVKHGRTPAQSEPGGRWLSTQRQVHLAGHLREDRRRELDIHLPRWAGTTRD
jgi:hypothetical protein